MTRMFSSSRIAMALALPVTLTALAGCGGGGSSPTPSPTPPPSNAAPQFTSASAASVAENSSGTVITLAANDPDGDTVSLTIAGGADASLFNLSGNQLSFASSPNFDTFADADGDNVFDVVLQASDGRGGISSQSLAVTVTNEREGIAVRRVASGFDRPAGLALFFGNNLLVGEQDGTIWTIDPVAGSQQVFEELNLAAGRELIDVAGDVIGPTILFPAGLVRDNTGIHLITGLGMGATGELTVASGNPGDARGTIGYATGNALGPSGALVIAIGDPGGQRAQNTGGFGSASFLVNADRNSTASDLIPFATGLRQPNGILNVGSEFFFGDQGGTQEHELNLLEGPPTGNLNFGWPFVEGTVTVASGAPSGLIAPALVHGFGGSSLSGEGLVGGTAALDSSSVPADLRDRLLIGDTSGKLFTFGLLNSLPQFENRTADLTPDVGTIDRVVDIAKDASGRIYILDADGELFVVESI